LYGIYSEINEKIQNEGPSCSNSSAGSKPFSAKKRCGEIVVVSLPGISLWTTLSLSSVHAYSRNHEEEEEKEEPRQVKSY
jgi:hypothetical protein